MAAPEQYPEGRRPEAVKMASPRIVAYSGGMGAHDALSSQDVELVLSPPSGSSSSRIISGNEPIRG